MINPGFEDGLVGWESAGAQDSEAHHGRFALRHGAGKLETSQALRSIPNGWYTLKAWLRSSDWQNTAYIALAEPGGAEVRAALPRVSHAWLQIVVSAEIKNQQCTIRLVSEVGDNHWVCFDDVELVAGRAALSILGADISSLKKSEDHGGVYYDEQGAPGDAMQILRDHGMNTARFRVWVNSPDGYHGKKHLLEVARRTRTAGLKLLVDFHYSDTWADPGKQPKPKAWAGLDFAGLQQAVYDHTWEVCAALTAQGTPPDFVQVGNEITNGMLWPDGRNDADFTRLAALLHAGVGAVKDAAPDARVMLHLDNGGNNAMCRRWFDQINAHRVPFDLIGLSYYPYWHGSFADFQANLNDLALRYGKDLVVVETAYAFTAEDQDGTENVATAAQATPGYPLTPAGQASFLAHLMTIVRAAPAGRGLGVMWWDAVWTAVPGNGWDPENPSIGNNWENQALFDFESRPLPALRLFRLP